MPSRRQQRGLRAPRPGDGSKVRTTHRRRTLYRAVASHDTSPWWYSSRDTAENPGRFDLTTPDGTCYWAVSIGGAILEAITDPEQEDPPLISLGGLRRMSVWQADQVAAARRTLADATVASLPGLTGEIGTYVPYEVTWQWADTFHAAGLHGIVYRGRFAQDDCLALFGAAGLHPHPEAIVSRRPATGLTDHLPAAYLGNVASVGNLDELDAAPPP